MKKFILPILCASLAFSSCCKKIACVEMNGLSIQFIGFSPSEIDTIYTTGFRLNTTFTDTAETAKIDTVKLSDGTTYLLHDFTSGGYTAYGSSLTDNYEWRLYIPSINRTIHIFNYGYNTYRCSNGCGFKRGEEVKSLSTCTVDNETQKAADIKIYK